MDLQVFSSFVQNNEDYATNNARASSTTQSREQLTSKLGDLLKTQGLPANAEPKRDLERESTGSE